MVAQEKIELMKMILETDNPGILSSIKKILKRASSKDFWDTLPQSQREEILLSSIIRDGEQALESLQVQIPDLVFLVSC